MSETVNPRVVVVEDEEATRRLLQRQLERAGYAVTACGDGQAALQPITEMGSGIVLADWDMPQMDGIELCRAARELQEMQTLGHIYFILLTAHDGKEHVIQGLEAGANDYLTKPYDVGELLARLQVGARFLRLQDELLQRSIEYQKANTQLALLTRRLEELAHTDTLTGLANRRCLFERFEVVWELASRHGHPLHCIMMDMDDFKSVNDRFGHEAGDCVLKAAADIIRQSTRRPDLCARFGGEEFVALCPELSREGAVALAERIRKGVAGHRVVFHGQDIAMSISCGVAGRTPDMRLPEDLLRKADAMLYAAKTHGRNQTWLADDAGQGQPIGAGARRA